MKFIPAFVIVFFTFPLVAAPVPKEITDWQKNFPGSTWSGDGIVGPTTYTFEKDGKLTYSRGSSSWRNGTWRIENGELYWEVNSKYAEFRGKFTNGVITGKAWNIRGGEWKLTFKPDSAGTHEGKIDTTIYK